MSAAPWGCFILSPRPKAPVNEIGDRVTDVGPLEVLSLLDVPKGLPTNPSMEHTSLAGLTGVHGPVLARYVPLPRPLPREDPKVSKG